MTGTAPTLDQRRALHAWEAVERAKRRISPHKDQEPKKFGGQAKRLPVRILTAGLGQALAFLEAKKYGPGLLAELSDWVLVERGLGGGAAIGGGKQAAVGTRTGVAAVGDGGRDRLLTAIVKGDSDFLRQATEEVLAYLRWLGCASARPRG